VLSQNIGVVPFSSTTILPNIPQAVSQSKNNRGPMGTCVGNMRMGNMGTGKGSMRTGVGEMGEKGMNNMERYCLNSSWFFENLLIS
jgi:hypothetical protein